MNIKSLVGSGDRIAMASLPVAAIAVLVNVADPSVFRVDAAVSWHRPVAAVLLIAGLIVWLWSVLLILQNVPRGRLITAGPYGWVKHPLYTAVALLILPAGGLLLDTWLGLAVGAAMYVASRRFTPAEEAVLSRTFGARWNDYIRTVKLGWL